jgi:hypothetical protein
LYNCFRLCQQIRVQKNNKTVLVVYVISNYTKVGFEKIHTK